MWKCCAIGSLCRMLIVCDAHWSNLRFVSFVRCSLVVSFSGVIAVDDWIKFRAPPEIGVLVRFVVETRLRVLGLISKCQVRELRRELDELLLRKIEQPSADVTEAAKSVTDAIVKLVSKYWTDLVPHVAKWMIWFSQRRRCCFSSYRCTCSTRCRSCRRMRARRAALACRTRCGSATRMPPAVLARRRSARRLALCFSLRRSTTAHNIS